VDYAWAYIQRFEQQ